FAKSEFYGLAQEMAKMGVGESLVSFMDEHGKSLPPIKVHWFPPQSHMGALSEGELSAAAKGPLKDKYQKREKSKRATFPGGSTPTAAPKDSSAKKAGFALWSALAWLLRGAWNVLSLAARKVVWPTLKWLAKWFAKKPKRILYLLLALALAYLAFTFGPRFEALSPLFGPK
ncbi:MAG: DUF853 family protein, partial [Candidatus Micrarchaeota archaeon]|nr:DUF853 family protein [Candidatus Micrarchaeota archaeon]